MSDVVSHPICIEVIIGILDFKAPGAGRGVPGLVGWPLGFVESPSAYPGISQISILGRGIRKQL